MNDPIATSRWWLLGLAGLVLGCGLEPADEDTETDPYALSHIVAYGYFNVDDVTPGLIAAQRDHANIMMVPLRQMVAGSGFDPAWFDSVGMKMIVWAPLDSWNCNGKLYGEGSVYWDGRACDNPRSGPSASPSYADWLSWVRANRNRIAAVLIASEPGCATPAFGGVCDPALYNGAVQGANLDASAGRIKADLGGIYTIVQVAPSTLGGMPAFGPNSNFDVFSVTGPYPDFDANQAEQTFAAARSKLNATQIMMVTPYAVWGSGITEQQMMNSAKKWFCLAARESVVSVILPYAWSPADGQPFGVGNSSSSGLLGLYRDIGLHSRNGTATAAYACNGK